MFEFVLKAIVHVVCFAMSFYALQVIDWNRLFKKNHVGEAWMFYLFMSMGLGYLVAGFILNVVNVG